MPTPEELKIVEEAKKAEDAKKAAEGAKPPVFDEWLSAQEEPIKALISNRFQALENTVKATREERDTVTKQLKELSKAQAEGSDTKKALEDTIAKLEATERRAAFLEDTIRPEVQCRNAKAAWALALADDLFDKRGHPDWNAIKQVAPELFGAPAANANAGNGTGNPPPSGKSMNNFIRAAAGRAP